MKGIVLEKEKKAVIVLRDDGQFVRLAGVQAEVGAEITLPSSRKKRLPLAIAACFVLLLFGFCFWSALYLPQSFIYIDINPGFCLDVNSQGQVIRVNATNQDAEAVVGGAKKFSSEVDECIEQIINLCQEKGYLENNSHGVQVHVAGKNDVKKSDLQ